MKAPRPIGYWYYPYRGEEILPHPRDLIRPGWISAGDKEKLVACLKGGATFETWRGHSQCRFRCGVADTKMGFRDFTDGVWVWPEGLYHYIGEHDVMLPPEFVAHCRAQACTIPPDAMQLIELTHQLNHAPWIAWAKEVHTCTQPENAANGSQQI
jgi:hypothetical protein